MLELAKRVRKNLPFLKSLSQAKNIPELLEKATDENILSIVEVCHNLIRFRFYLHSKQLQALRKFADQIRFIARIRDRVQAQQTLATLPPLFFSRLLGPLFRNYK